jgi:hypothetical protein
MAKSIRISDTLYDLAAAQARLMHRSLAQQLEHWASLGQALELQADSGTILRTSLANLHAVDRHRVRNGRLSARDLHMIPARIAREASLTFSAGDFADLDSR